MKKKIFKYLFTCIFLTSNLHAIAQGFELKISAIDSTQNEIINKIHYKKFHKTIDSAKIETDSFSSNLEKKGYINNHIKSIKIKDSIYNVKIKLGAKIDYITIYYNDAIIPKSFIRTISADYTITSFSIPINEVPFVLNTITSELERLGNTFTEVSLKNITPKKNLLYADLKIKTNKERQIDKIIVNKYENFPPSFVKHYLNLKKEKTFNSGKLKYASNATKSLRFASEIKSPEVLFTKDSTTIYLYIEKVKANKFDGLIGFNSNEEGGLELNGYFDLLLTNILNKGETLSIEWKSNGDDRKVFNIAAEAPYIFNAPISPKGSLNIYKQDSSFVNIKTNLDVALTINPRNTFTLKYQSEASNDLRNVKSQNNIEQYKSTFYGGAYTYRVIHPTRQYQNKFFFNVDGLIGNRTLTNTNNKTQQQKYQSDISYNWSLNLKNSIFIRNRTGILISDDYLSNELFRIGGANSLRGFNEESIFASTFSIVNLEYQYYLVNYSYLYTITDFAYVNNNLDNIDNKLYGFGLGYVYTTKSGLVDISYALGKVDDIPFDFNNSKFHIKLIQFF